MEKEERGIVAITITTEWVLLCLFRLSGLIEAKSHWLHLCKFKMMTAAAMRSSAGCEIGRRLLSFATRLKELLTKISFLGDFVTRTEVPPPCS